MGWDGSSPERTEQCVAEFVLVELELEEGTGGVVEGFTVLLTVLGHVEVAGVFAREIPLVRAPGDA